MFLAAFASRLSPVNPFFNLLVLALPELLIFLEVVVLASVRLIGLLLHFVWINIAEVVLENIRHNRLRQNSIVATTPDNKIALRYLVYHFFHSLGSHTRLQIWLPLHVNFPLFHGQLI